MASFSPIKLAIEVGFNSTFDLYVNEKVTYCYQLSSLVNHLSQKNGEASEELCSGGSSQDGTSNLV